MPALLYTGMDSWTSNPGRALALPPSTPRLQKHLWLRKIRLLLAVLVKPLSSLPPPAPNLPAPSFPLCTKILQTLNLIPRERSVGHIEWKAS